MNVFRRLFESKDAKTERLKNEAEARRLAEEGERKRQAEVAEAAEQRRIAREAKVKRQAEEERVLLLLAKAIERFDYQTLEALLVDNGLNPNAKDRDGCAALDLAIGGLTSLEFCRGVQDAESRAKQGEHLLQVLLKHGADKNHTIQRLQEQSNAWKRLVGGYSQGMSERGVPSYRQGSPPGQEDEDIRQAIVKFLKGWTDRRITRLVVFKTGSQPTDEKWYLQRVLEAIGLSNPSFGNTSTGQNALHKLLGRLGRSSLPEGTPIDFRCVNEADLNETYIMGYAMESRFDVACCTLTPFADRDGGKGIVLKVLSE